MTIGVSALLATAIGACGEAAPQVTSKADVVRYWDAETAEVDRSDLAYEIANANLLRGTTRAETISILGRPNRRRTGPALEWSNNCSGPGCYYLSILFDRRDRVVRAGFNDG